MRAVIALLEEDMDSGELIVQLFEGFFSVVSEEHSTKVRRHMIVIMVRFSSALMLQADIT